MATRFDAKVGETLDLEAKFSLDGVPYDVDLKKVELLDHNLIVVQTVSANDVVHLAVGHYRATFTELTDSGTFSDHWYYKEVENGAYITFVLSVEVEGVLPEQGEDSPEGGEESPDIGASNVCVVSHRFFDAGGNGFEGVYVRFSPKTAIESRVLQGSIVREATVSSDEDGNLSIALVRGITGLMAVTGIGIVREVTIPNVASIDLFELLATADDLYEVQRPEYVTLPRES